MMTLPSLVSSFTRLVSRSTEADGASHPTGTEEGISSHGVGRSRLLRVGSLVVVALIGCDSESDSDADVPAAAGNGVEYPVGFEDWRLLGITDRIEGGAADAGIRVILGNDLAVNAARSGQTSPWPNGSMIADVVWADAGNLYERNDVFAPGSFRALAFMEKDPARFTQSGGWGYGLWTTPELLPEEQGFDQDCIDCHTARVSDNDFVFTRPPVLPSPSTVQAAIAAPNGLTLPPDFLDWRVVGLSRRVMGEQMRVVLGNDTAVDAARSGRTNPWPDGTQFADVVWANTTNPDWEEMIAPGNFALVAFMSRNQAQYATTGGWAYSAWVGNELTPPQEAGVNLQGCVDCHTAMVGPQNDYVFTRPGQLPLALP